MAAEEESGRGFCTTRQVFRGVEYVVTMSADAHREVLSLQVEDKLTTDRWSGDFDARYIEELTRRTGNFKQFNVFVNMLELGCTKESGAVSLDLLTYGDLETLRSLNNSKTGRTAQEAPATKAASHLHTKRYLIMTYTVEFDRIHYPLPLSYVGKPDPVKLQETIRKLTEENQLMKEQLNKGSKSVPLSRLQKEFDQLNQENEQLLLQFESYKREMKHVGKANTGKEIKVLKKVVQNLESQLLKEKNKYQRILSKKNQEFKTLVAELEEVRASERNLRARCRSLTNELAVLKRGSRSRATPSPRVGTGKENRRSLSQERGNTAKPSTRRRSRTPSPAGSRVPLFDPTAYVKERQRKQREASLARGRRRSSSAGSAPRPRPRSLSSERSAAHASLSGRRRVRTSSAGSAGSRCSSRSSASGLSDASEGRRARRSHREALAPKTRSATRSKSTAAWSSPEASDRGRHKVRRVHTTPYSSTPDQSPELYRAKGKKHRHATHRPGVAAAESLDRSADMMEIDARLDALQKFMKANLQ